MKIIGITGGSGSGKTTVVNHLTKQLDGISSLLSLDSYYHDQSHLKPYERENVNYDHPDAIDYPLLISHIKGLMNGNRISCPVYSYLTHCRLKKTVMIKPAAFLFIEGLLMLNHQQLLRLLDIIIYLDVSGPFRLKRIIDRDCAERGRTNQQVIARFEQVVKPMHEKFVGINKSHADFIIDNQDIQNTLKQLKEIISNIK